MSLRERARSLQYEYDRGKPFPHVILDGLLDSEALDGVLEEWPADDSEAWKTYYGKTEWLKRDIAHPQLLGPRTQALLHTLQHDATWLEFVRTLTGFRDIVGDIWGGGLHEVKPGGKLAIHVDFNMHPYLNRRRVLNFLIFLNKDWDPAWGGELQLWNADVSQWVTAVWPHFNTSVIFTCSDKSYHGHPEPLRCPEGITRKSLAVYYYDDVKVPSHSTIYRARPGEEF